MEFNTIEEITNEINESRIEHVDRLSTFVKKIDKYLFTNNLGSFNKFFVYSERYNKGFHSLEDIFESYNIPNFQDNIYGGNYSIQNLLFNIDLYLNLINDLSIDLFPHEALNRQILNFYKACSRACKVNGFMLNYIESDKKIVITKLTDLKTTTPEGTDLKLKYIKRII